MEKKPILGSSWAPYETVANIKSSIHCGSVCMSKYDCNAFAFQSTSNVCKLGFRSTKVLRSENENSLENEIFTVEGYYKLMLIGGMDFNGIQLNSVEIIDLETDQSVCNKVQNYPLAIKGVSGGKLDSDSLIVCGGYPGTNQCFRYQSNEWKSAPSTNDPREYASTVDLSTFKNSSQKLFMTGSESGVTSEVFDGEKWSRIGPNTPKVFFFSCATDMNSTAIMVIGGGLSGSTNTYIFDMEKNEWFTGPSLINPRGGASCGKVFESRNSKKLLIIAVGGFVTNWVQLSSVEVYDENSMSWRVGPTLPIAMGSVSLVNHPRGGVLFIGGADLYHLHNVGVDSKWILLSQKPKIPRFYFTAILVPDSFVNCSVTSNG